MKAKEIEVGAAYVAKVSGKLTAVRVDAIRDYSNPINGRLEKRFDVTNLRTNRRTTFRSAAKFRNKIITSGPIHSPMMAFLRG